MQNAHTGRASFRRDRVPVELPGGSQAAVLFSYSSFSNTTGLTLVGNAAATTTTDGTVMRLTPALGGQAGAIYSTTAVPLGTNATFSTQFQFRFTSPGGVDPADGITFVIANATGGLGGSGNGMGYAGSSANSLAIEFDTYNNSIAAGGLGEFAAEPNSSNHVAIDIGGVLTNTAPSNVYGNASCGFHGRRSRAKFLRRGRLHVQRRSLDRQH